MTLNMSILRIVVVIILLILNWWRVPIIILIILLTVVHCSKCTSLTNFCKNEEDFSMSAKQSLGEGNTHYWICLFHFDLLGLALSGR